MPAHARRSVTDIILYIYPSREPIVRNHEPRAKALGNYIYIYIYILSGVHNPCGERSIQPAVTIVQTAKFIYAWVLLTSNG